MLGAKYFIVLSIALVYFENWQVERRMNDGTDNMCCTSNAIQIEAAKPTASEPEQKVLLKFDQLELIVELEEVWSEEKYLQMIHSDSMIVDLGLMSKIFGHTFTIQKTEPSIKSLKVWQNYETSLTLMDEGPHVDLTDWKHFTSDWKEIKIESNQFTTFEYTEQEWQKFPYVTQEEIVNAIGSVDLFNAPERWLDLARQCKNANDYPCGVSISRIRLNFVLTDTSGQETEKLLIFNIPMGC